MRLHMLSVTGLLLAAETLAGAPFESTNLPLVVINTNGQYINDEPKITAEIKIIYNGLSGLNHPDDPGNIYSGLCGIEYRGAYSLSLPQKSYGFETQDELGDNNNVPILGMPEENDWALLASYNDKTFMRNTLAFHLSEMMGHYAPRNRICEVIINDEYLGVYILTEKIKRDDNRVDISKLDEDDNAGDSLTGGYIFKVDYFDETNSWTSNYSPPDRPDDEVHFVYEYPEPEVITASQKNYIQDFVGSYETALYSPEFTDRQVGYRAFISVKSLIDYFIIGEVSRNVDAYKKSCFHYKDRDDKGGQLHFGPVWDYDWAWKNMDDNCDIFAATDGSGWAYEVNGCNSWPVAPAWILRMMEDDAFQDQLFTRYTDLRSTILSEEYLYHYIDSIHSLVEEAQERHYEKWPILGINVGTPEVDEQPTTYDGEITKFKNWIATRLNWLDSNMPGEYNPLREDLQPIAFRVFPNPASGIIYIESDRALQKVEIYNTAGTLVMTQNPCGSFSLPADIGILRPGLFIMKITFGDSEIRTAKFIVTSK